ncbi:MAG: sodium-translocating pyrophosphatase [Flavobacteriales bacterium]
MEDNLIYIIPVMGLIGLFVMGIKANWVSKQDAGEQNMKDLASHIAEGAMAFLKAEWKMLGYYAVIAGLLLAWSGTMAENSSWVISLAFLVGCFFSCLAGYIGMNIATKANVRTAQKARSNLPDALKVSFNGGTVMGLGVAGLVVLGMGGLFILFYQLYVGGSGEIYGHDMEKALEVLAGFSLGSESIALFARVGGGIYTKAADVGADLVGKVEAGIPEDDPRNPATVADNVGDNVGDVAGMGADLFGSYVATVLAAMVLGREVPAGGVDGPFGGIAPVLLPLVIAGLGLLFSIVGAGLVRVKGEKSSVQNALNLGNWTAILLTVISGFFVITWMLPADSYEFRGVTFSAYGVFGASVVGLIVGALMSWITEYYTADGYRPVKSIARQSSTGDATNIIAGIGIGMESTLIPTIILGGGIIAGYACAGLYGIGITAASLMATTAMQLAIDAFGPIADNAGGIAEMSELPDDVRDRTDNLDAVGNTTAASGKGFAIASAALTALALFAAFVGMTGITAIDLYKAPVLAGLFIGGMIPYIFSSLAIGAVGRAAMSMVQEVRRQFHSKPGILEGSEKPEYDNCVDISTKASLKEMMLPGAIAILTPIIVGVGFQGVFVEGQTVGPNDTSSAEILGGVLSGVLVSGVLMAFFQCNAGGAWDNAKKTIEDGFTIDGEETGKGSEAHKASVTGDTVGDPLKDTSGPSMNILIKLMMIVSLVIAPHIGIKTEDAKGKNSKGNSKEKALDQKAEDAKERAMMENSVTFPRKG